MITHCPKCNTELKDAPGIGLYCPTKGCEIKDGPHVCLNCKHFAWLVGIGQGLRCSHPDHKYSTLWSGDQKRRLPTVPNRYFRCLKWEEKVEESV
jgi:hypothetical protein